MNYHWQDISDLVSSQPPSLSVSGAITVLYDLHVSYTRCQTDRNLRTNIELPVEHNPLRDSDDALLRLI